MILIYYIMTYVSAPVSAPVSANSISQKKTGVKPRLAPIPLYLDVGNRLRPFRQHAYAGLQAIPA